MAKSQRDANTVKRNEPITVVMGIPLTRTKRKGIGGWVESGAKGRAAPLDRLDAPRGLGCRRARASSEDLYVYFWRWATWKVFGSGLTDATGLPEKDEDDIVCFITVAGFLNGPGFERMREDLRRTCSEIWVVDCSPEGHQPEMATRIFQDVQQPVCIVLAARKLEKIDREPGRLQFRPLPKSKREEKFAALNAVA